MLIIAPPLAIPYLENFIAYVNLPKEISLVDGTPETPEEFLALVHRSLNQTSPVRWLFALLDLPPGKDPYQHTYKGVHNLVRYHTLPGNIHIRPLFSRPGFSLWLSLHPPVPPTPTNPDRSPFEDTTMDSVNTAIKQAQLLARQRTLRPDDYELPFTETHELISHLLRMQKRVPNP